MPTICPRLELHEASRRGEHPAPDSWWLYALGMTETWEGMHVER
ncbi:hypothetical protein [Leifsonia sp. NPDC058230]